MTGKIIAQLISVMIFVYMVLIGITFIIHITITERINDICYDVADTISTEGVLSSEVYNYLCENISKYGDYTVTILLKDRTETGTTYCYGESEVIDVPLSGGDRVIIGVACENQSLLERITGADSRISTVRTAVIA